MTIDVVPYAKGGAHEAPGVFPVHTSHAHREGAHSPGCRRECAGAAVGRGYVAYLIPMNPLTARVSCNSMAWSLASRPERLCTVYVPWKCPVLPLPVVPGAASATSLAGFWRSICARLAISRAVPGAQSKSGHGHRRFPAIRCDRARRKPSFKRGAIAVKVLSLRCSVEREMGR